MTQVMKKPLMAGGLWFPELKTWVMLVDPVVRVRMITENRDRQFFDFVVCVAPLAKVVTINEMVGAIQQLRARIYEDESGTLVCDYLYEEMFGENDLIRFANVFKASIA